MKSVNNGPGENVPPNAVLDWRCVEKPLPLSSHLIRMQEFFLQYSSHYLVSQLYKHVQGHN